MLKKLAFLTILGAALTALLPTSPASAQATRTWVSGVGDDANPCSRTAPCKTFAGAISKTAPGGEIDALDPGGFGALTITKSITLDGGGGQVASILVAGTNGIVVNGGSSDVIIIRNLRFDGLRGAGNANAGLAGIKFLTGAKLIIENCDLFGFNTAGIQIAPSASGGSVMISSTQVQNNAIGILMDGTGGSVNASLREVVSTENAGDGIQVNGGIHAGLTLDHGTSSFNGGNGVLASGGAAVVILGNSTIVGNTTGVSAAGGATLQSWKNNQIGGNVSDGTPITAFPGPGGTALQ
jgi:hypothetical protein